MSGKRKISLVLGSGAARGLTHIGVIRCLEEHHYDIKYISGSSIGALVGGIYAAGELDVYVEWVKALKRRNIIRLLDISFSRKSLFKGEKIIEVLNEIIKDRTIEDLPIGYTAVATDILEQKEIWLTSGSLFEAIRASIAVPMIFSPVQYSDRLLVDGGIINPVPIAPTLNDDTELTIAVALNGPSEIFSTECEEVSEASEENHAKNKYQLGVEKLIDSMLPKGDVEKDKHNLGIFNLMTQSMDTMQSSITRFKLATYRPDIVIEIPRNICGWFDFDRADELIEFGYERTTDALKQYEKLLERRK
ncbi:MAG: serine protease [Gammaproteobacteria bacterium]|nr:MAG: serine protease [Gammaproteobacteria bacterium]